MKLMDGKKCHLRGWESQFFLGRLGKSLLLRPLQGELLAEFLPQNGLPPHDWSHISFFFGCVSAFSCDKKTQNKGLGKFSEGEISWEGVADEKKKY